MIHEVSGGIPRVVSVICDNALLNGFAIGRRRSARTSSVTSCRDFDMKAAATGEPPSPESTDAPAEAARGVVEGHGSC